ncbi:MAG: tyrosine-type recombinase/integrase [Candidatus Dormiibacterota bacterium]
MSPLREALQDYLDVRRAVGFRLVQHTQLLAALVTDLEIAGATTLTTEAALAWATKPAGVDPARWAVRLGMARGFARYLQVLDPATEVPSTDLLPRRARRQEPFIYSEAQINALLTAAGALRAPLRAATLTTLIGLLAVTGMRPGEALRLDRSDLDAAGGLLTIRDSKFRKSRELPLHPSTVAALAGYAQTRDELSPRQKTSRLFVSLAGTALIHTNVDRTFQGLVARAGLDCGDSRRSPRLHDLRHSFAVKTVVGWYQAGVDVDARMALLSTYMGHAEPANTYWYLSAVPELLVMAAQRLERSKEQRS